MFGIKDLVTYVLLIFASFFVLVLGYDTMVFFRHNCTAGLCVSQDSYKQHSEMTFNHCEESQKKPTKGQKKIIKVAGQHVQAIN